MAKVIIYDDTSNIAENIDGIFVKNLSDYVDTYDKIQDAIYKGEELKVIVGNKYCIKCFERMAQLYGNEYIDICIYSPINELSKILNMYIPKYLTNEDIANSKLLTKIDSLQFSKGMGFEDVIISNYLSPYLAYQKFPFKILMDILDNMDFNQFKGSLTISLVAKVYYNRIERWKSSIKEEYEMNILKQFISNPELLYKNLYKYLLLSKYPDRLYLSLIGDNAKNFEKIDFKFTPSIREDVDTLAIRDSIKVYLHGLAVCGLSKEEIINIIRIMTGYFPEEFDFTVDMLKKNINIIDEEIINNAKSKFVYLKNSIPEYEEILNNIIPPVVPLPPGKINNIEDWIKWSRNQYFRYRFWMEENNQYDETVDGYSNIYGNWLFENYINLMSSYKYMVFKTIVNINDNLKQDELSVVLIIDNFNYKYVSLLKELFLEEGFSNTIDRPMISLLPSETSVSKVSLFSGTPYNYGTSKSYNKMCNEWERLLNKKVKYISNIGELKEQTNKNADIYVVNYLEIDNILHTNQKDYAQSTGARVKEELHALIKLIASFIKKIGFGNNAKIYVCSDHGSTKIIKDKINLIDQKYYKGKSDDAAHRYITITDENIKHLNNNISSFCYIMDKSQYGTNENYLIAREYFRFIETDKNFYVHGGVTPEETIIPLLKFEKIEAVAKYPIIVLKEHEFRHAVKAKIILEITNVNDYPISDLEVIIQNSNIKSVRKSMRINSIDELKNENLIFDEVRIMKESNEEDNLNINVTFNFLGKQYEKEYQIPIKIRTIQQNLINFDDLF